MTEVTTFISANAPVFYTIGGVAVIGLAAAAIFKKPKIQFRRRR